MALSAASPRCLPARHWTPRVRPGQRRGEAAGRRGAGGTLCTWEGGEQGHITHRRRRRRLGRTAEPQGTARRWTPARARSGTLEM
jgi:hypothetical protein